MVNPLFMKSGLGGVDRIERVENCRGDSDPQFMKSGLGGAGDFLWRWEFLRVGTREKFDRGGKNF
jgi:hypothetical protein